MKAYFLHGSDGEKLMVIRGHDEETMIQIIDTLKRSRHESVKELADGRIIMMGSKTDSSGN